MLSGSGPSDEPAFAALARLGVRSIVSVDGARPAVELAAAHGLTYAHIPIQYGGLEPDQHRAIVAAVARLPRPIYVHCHHGRHRGPTAAVIGLIGTGELPADEPTPGRPGGTPLTAEAPAADGFATAALLSRLGTSPRYAGLYAAARAARPLSADELADLPAEFVSDARPSELVAVMTELQARYDRLDLVQQAGWHPPEDHPDLVPIAEAGAVHELFRGLTDTADVPAEDTAFFEFLSEATRAASELEAALRARPPAPNTAPSAAADPASIAGGAAGADGHRAAEAGFDAGFDAGRLDGAFRALGEACFGCHIGYLSTRDRDGR